MGAEFARPPTRATRVIAADRQLPSPRSSQHIPPGAAAFRPDIPGLDSPRVTTLRTVEDSVALRERVTGGADRAVVLGAVVLGAGFIGIEAAEALRMAGLDVTLVEFAPHVLPPLEDEIASRVHAELLGLGIDVRVGTAATAVESGTDHDTVVLDDGSRIDADIVVLSVGVRPDTTVFAAAGLATDRGAISVDEHGRTNLERVWAVGDATLSVDAVTGVQRPVALAGPANRAGRLVADDILRPGSARPIPRTLGTAIVRVGSLAVGSTGANRAALAASGRPFHTIHLHPNQHAGYFPGAEQLHIIVHFGHDGTLYGAQIAGTDGVDKRIDVLASAIRGGLSAPGLIDLDLAYAPPYGSAKDPVNFIGMEAENVLSGQLRLWYAQDLAAEQESALVLDARSSGEFAGGHIPGSLNIPHTELRGRMDEVRRAAGERPVRVLCASGVRSYIAHRALVDAGFDSASLSGGILTLRDVLGDRAAEELETGAGEG